MASILVADREDLAREGLKTIIIESKLFDSIFEVNNNTELSGLFEKETIDIVIIDCFGKNDFSIQDLYYINTRYPKTAILVITNELNEEVVQDALNHDVKGFILKCCKKKEIITALKNILMDEKFFCGSVLNTILSERFQQKSTKFNLTEREIEIIELISRGQTTQGIADNLCRSMHTINTHRKNILKKLNLKNKSDLVRFALENGILNS